MNDSNQNPPTAAFDLLDESSRDELAVKHLDLVARVVGRLPISIPAGLDRDDLISVGTLGLLHAARTYQPMRGASFRTFAYMAIRASILDELRRHDPLPRGARARIRQLNAYESEFRGQHGRVPTPQEIAEHLALSPVDAEELLEQAETLRYLRVDTAVGDDGDEAAFEPADPTPEDPSAHAERMDDLKKVEDAICDLSPRERQVIVLYHAEGMYLREIGAVLGVTESRICQILTCAQRKIKARVGRTLTRRTTNEDADDG
ncbi:MAG: FliA/WhiG family RNA polymerase sigma factor [Planctomycetes bacterium]|nr:FliA/WhiG family RNA polymerase sigma factor [Planctomycetota bacterium]MCC7169075.1 FliA/WhiG family RNA polymerase sigma factor [Planctomycetota bacterium]